MFRNSAPPSESEWQDAEGDAVEHLRSQDWTLNGCDFDREEKLERKDDVDVIYRVWRNCGQSDRVLYDGVALPSHGPYVAWIQIQLSKGAGEKIAGHILETFRVLPERLEDAD